jgi:hypothetical protein
MTGPERRKYIRALRTQQRAQPAHPRGPRSSRTSAGVLTTLADETS